MNGNLPLIVEDAKRLGDAVFGIYPTLAERYTATIGPVVNADQQKILFDLAVACIGIANKEQRVSQMREERKNGNGRHPRDYRQRPRLPTQQENHEVVLPGSTHTL
jgi:regulator of PEP synthase PpsR (kinase-PPPase family)